MAVLDFALLSYGRPGYGLPQARLVNMFPEPTPAGPARAARLPRPGLEQVYTLGVAGLRGFYQQDGVFGGDIFAVSGTDLYRAQTWIGTVALTTQARFAASYAEFVIVAGGIAYRYDGATLSTITIPDGQMVVDVAIVGARFYFLIQDSDRVYFSDLDDAATVDALSFFTADSQPDGLIGAAVVGDQLMLFGRTSVEPWHQTGDPNAPLVRSLGATYTKGCASIRSIVFADNRPYWLGNDLKFYTVGAQAVRVSDHSIEQRFRECEAPSDIHAFTTGWDGHEFIVLNVPGQGSFALHVESGTWGEWTSHQRTTFRCSTALMVGSTPYLGDASTGAVFRLADVFTDDGDPIEFIATATAPPGQIAVLELDCATGVGLYDNSDPIVEMRYSIDGGQTWSVWRQATLGLIGDYLNRARWRRLGLSRRPWQIEFRTTSPVRTVYAGARANER